MARQEPFHQATEAEEDFLERGHSPNVVALDLRLHAPPEFGGGQQLGQCLDCQALSLLPFEPLVPAVFVDRAVKRG